MTNRLKKLAASLPLGWQQELKRLHFGRQIRSRSFQTHEPEYDLLPSMVASGNWVIDVGANIGHYTLRLSELVGEQGRVISFEPVPETFELLAAHAALATSKNITLINAAAAELVGLANMEIPKFTDTGLSNYYMAHLSNALPQCGLLQVLCLSVDSLELPHTIGLVKIDAEGHEVSVLRGMKRLLSRDHPTIIVEDNDIRLDPVLKGLGYCSEKITGSSNRIFRPTGTSQTSG